MVSRLGLTWTGIMWDDKTELLHWVDIDEAKVHS